MKCTFLKRPQSGTELGNPGIAHTADPCGIEPCPEALHIYQQAASTGAPLIGEVPSCLLSLGLLEEIPDSPGEFLALPPSAAEARITLPIEREMAKLRQSLEVTRITLAQADSAYQQAMRNEGKVHSIVRGADVINTLLAREVDSCTKELRTVQPGGGRPTTVLQQAVVRDLALLGRGVRQRTLYQETIRAHGPTLEYARRIREFGGQVRTLSEVADRLIICDQRVAFIPVSDDRASSALEIREPALIRYLARGFDLAWDRAQSLAEESVSPSRPQISSDVQLKIVQLVVEGHTDKAIAGRVGTSARTVAEHVRRVSDQLGSRSRAEFGYLVAKSNLLQDA
ncbi:LuxR C-terminal-related transcriptional regulator [Streptomyces sp. AP-93]|uniref:LuxR C-terminal-related transcriptional regulator n=1 Tax=Streptomyces sp. AP-93 TaxID=2929048 RepID=UPI001FAF21B6|nr:LuxR C-terminal-related transcriptional regulator [Streptomyces sp. AP-93]MCJ0875555.1 LuxR C-terminal-related transcriptional regulator [Streptomyces sp. AP-93]